MLHQLNESVSYIHSQTKEFRPKFGIILGTGLGALINDVDVEYNLTYEDIPHFPVSTVEMHKGNLVFGQLEGVDVVIMQGRFHFYEGYSMKEVTFPVRVMQMLGIETLLISNAAGGINTSFELSDLMIIRDHINLMPENPLTGENHDDLGPRWPDMFDAYNSKLVKKGIEIAKTNDLNCKTGVYAGVPGPNLETPAEYKYLSIIGADAVGMSTVPEVIVARHMSLPVFAVSVITDLCYPGALEPVSIEKIISAAATAEPKMATLFKEMVKG